MNVLRYKFVAVLVSGGLAGLGGGFLAMVASSDYRDGQTGGRGYIGLAAMIFGNWRPGGLVAGSGLFGYTETLGLRQGGTSVHALLLAIAVAGGWRSPCGRRGPAAASSAGDASPASRLVIGAGLLLDRRGARRLHPDDAVRHHAGGARLRRRNDYECPPPTGRSIARAALVRSPRWRHATSTGTALKAEAVAAMQHAYAPYSGFKVGAAATGSRTAGSSPAATSRTRRTASRCAPSAGWCRSCTSPAGAG